MTTTDTTGTAAAGTGPADWKNYDDFAAGIDGNRLPNTPALAGRRIEINDDGGSCVVRFGEGSAATWQDADGERTAWYEAVEARPGLFFATVRGEGRPGAPTCSSCTPATAARCGSSRGSPRSGHRAGRRLNRTSTPAYSPGPTCAARSPRRPGI